MKQNKACLTKLHIGVFIMIKTLEQLSKKGKDFLGTETAILCGAMSWVSERNLVSAVSNNGGFGVIACGAMTSDLLEQEIIETKKLTNKPFGVNLITMHPQLKELIDVCERQKVTHIILAGGLPKSDSITQIKSFGAKVICFAPAVILAKRLIRSGADAIIIEGSEAGGHIGPVATSVLAQEFFNAELNVPIFIAGGIATGATMASYLEQGASGIQIGTLFAASEESIAHPNFKRIFCKSNAKDAITTVSIDPEFPVIPVRAIENKGTKEFIKVQKETIEKYHNNELTKNEALLQIEHYWAGALRKAVIDGDIEYGSLMAGQSVGMVKKVIPTAQIIETLISQAKEFLNK